MYFDNKQMFRDSLGLSTQFSNLLVPQAENFPIASVYTEKFS